MNADLLDLVVHGRDLIPGKLIAIGPAECVLGEQMQEPNGAWVYPLRNLKSGFSWFIGRFEKLLREARDREDPGGFRQVDFGTFQMALAGFPVVQTETHDVPGGAVQIRRAMDPPREAAFQPELMKKASGAMESGRWNEAREVYSSVLERNPNHHSAMVNLARGSGAPGSGLQR